MLQFRRICISILLLAGSFLTLSAGTGDGGKCVPLNDLKESSLVFKGGEKLTFAVHYKWGMVNADVANAVLKVEPSTLNGSDVFHGSISAKTKNLYASLFTVNEQLDSWFTRDGLVPMKFTRDAVEGKYTCKNTYSYNWTAGNINATVSNTRKGEFSKDLPLDKCTYDIPLLYFTLRNMDVSQLSVGTRYPMTFAVDDDIYPLHFIYLGKEERKIPGIGTVRCLKFGFQVVAGDVFSGDSDLYGWFTDDENRIPVLFKAPLKVGKVEIRLTSYSSIKHSFDSLVKAQ